MRISKSKKSGIFFLFLMLIIVVNARDNMLEIGLPIHAYSSAVKSCIRDGKFTLEGQIRDVETTRDIALAATAVWGTVLAPEAVIPAGLWAVLIIKVAADDVDELYAEIHALPTECEIVVAENEADLSSGEVYGSYGAVVGGGGSYGVPRGTVTVLSN